MPMHGDTGPSGTIVVKDIVDGARVSFSKTGGYVSANRVFVLDFAGGTGGGGGQPLAPSGNLPEDLILAAALSHPELPSTGAPHQMFPGLFVDTKTARAESGQSLIVRVDVSYKRNDEDQPAPGGNFALRFSSTSQQIETMVDRQGVPIVVTFTPPGKSIRKQGAVIHPDIAAETISLSETAQSADPTAITRVWQNAVNTGPFFYDTNASAGEWRIVEISAELIDATTIPFATWRFSFVIVKKPEIIVNVVGGHNPQVYFVDDNGDPPDGLVAGEGYLTVPWYDVMDFGNLFG